MVIPVDIDVHELARLGKKFPWAKPSACPRCGGGLWWHGYVTAYLACFAEAIFLRRLFCPCCFSVHRLRPNRYWSRFQSSIKIIEQVISYRQEQGRWRPDLPRPRQRQWWYRLRKKVQVCLGLFFSTRLPDAFVLLLAAGAAAVSSVIQCGDRAAFSHPTEVYP